MSVPLRSDIPSVLYHILADRLLEDIMYQIALLIGRTAIFLPESIISYFKVQFNTTPCNQVVIAEEAHYRCDAFKEVCTFAHPKILCLSHTHLVAIQSGNVFPDQIAA